MTDSSGRCGTCLEMLYRLERIAGSWKERIKIENSPKWRSSLLAGNKLLLHLPEGIECIIFCVFQEIESQIDRICEMGEVMRKAIQVDDDQFFKVREKLAQLEVRTNIIAKGYIKVLEPLDLFWGFFLYYKSLTQSNWDKGGWGWEIRNEFCLFSILDVSSILKREVKDMLQMIWFPSCQHCINACVTKWVLFSGGGVGLLKDYRPLIVN